MSNALRVAKVCRHVRPARISNEFTILLRFTESGVKKRGFQLHLTRQCTLRRAPAPVRTE